MLEGEIYKIWKVGAVQDDFKVNQKRISVIKNKKLCVKTQISVEK